MNAVPETRRSAGSTARDHVLVADNLMRHYDVKRGMFGHGTVKALNGVSFELERGKTLRWSASPAAANRRWRAS